MKLDRNINNDGRGKYALLKLRVFEEFAKGGEIQELPYDIRQALDVLEREASVKITRTLLELFGKVR